MVHASSKPQFPKAARSERSPCRLSPISPFSNSEAPWHPLPARSSPSYPLFCDKDHSSYLFSARIDVRAHRPVRPVRFISFHGILNLVGARRRLSRRAPHNVICLNTPAASRNEWERWRKSFPRIPRSTAEIYESFRHARIPFTIIATSCNTERPYRYRTKEASELAHV